MGEESETIDFKNISSMQTPCVIMQLRSDLAVERALIEPTDEDVNWLYCVSFLQLSSLKIQ